jgi:rhodanese-related sulfurtransferase
VQQSVRMTRASSARFHPVWSRRWLGAVAACAVTVIVASADGLARTDDPVIKIGAAALIGRATSEIRPAYPEAALGRRVQGVVVCNVRVGVTGRTRFVEIVQAPDRDIGEALRAALMGVTFGRMLTDPTTGRPAELQAKLFWYFVIERGRGLVMTPEQLAAHRGLRSVTQGLGAAGSVPTIDEPAWNRLSRGADVVLLDIRKREAFAAGHLPHAINIPEDEVWARLWELPRSSQVVVDCPGAASALCSTVVRELQRSGFDKLAVLKRNVPETGRE